MELAKSDEMALMTANRTSIGLYPPTEWDELVQKAFMDVAPKGLGTVQAAMCGTCAIEGAYKFAFMAKGG